MITDNLSLRSIVNEIQLSLFRFRIILYSTSINLYSWMFPPRALGHPIYRIHHHNIYCILLPYTNVHSSEEVYWMDNDPFCIHISRPTVRILLLLISVINNQ